MLDTGILLQQVTQLVDALRQAVARETVDGILDRPAVGERQRRLLDIDGQLGARVGDQPIMSININYYW